MDWTVADIVAATDGRLLYGAAESRVERIGIDSRTVSSDALFVPIRGDRYDAHDFLPEVIDKGVRAVVVAADTDVALPHDNWKLKGISCVVVDDTTRALGALARFRRRQMKIPVVAITGSNGKTTTRQMTASVLAIRFKTLATEGNLNNEIGLPLTLLGLERSHQAAVVELGINHFGEMDRLGAICEPTIGMITNVGPAHLEFLGDLEGVRRAKGELLAHIGPQGTLILNKDDAHVAALAAESRCPVLFFGTAPQAEVRAESIDESQSGVRFDLVLPDQRVKVELKTPGRFMVFNALAAAAAGHLAGLGAEGIVQGLASFQPSAGRLHVVETKNGVNIIDDTYNANPQSMMAAIQTFTGLWKSGNGFIVLGDMLELGDQAEALHRQIGSTAAETGADRVYAYGDFSGYLIAGAKKAGMIEENLMAGTKEEIAADLVQRLQPGDWILVKGSRGMTMETVVRAILQWASSSAKG
ncbi:MAG: UDP-N-acetylmuramoyl-tripeptide--D-alanyl-D-alanine ligase [Desulfobacteraceae bacterium]